MPQIRPITELRNNFTDISKMVHQSKEPIFLTKNGYGEMVVMSMETYESMQGNQNTYFKLKEAELEAKATERRYSHEEVFSQLRSELEAEVAEKGV